jgi:protein-tyrosine phosphatase
VSSPVIGQGGSDGGVLRVLVVCSANVSRSPLAAALLGRRLAAAGTPAIVRSAGIMRTRLAVDPLAVVTGRELEVDIGAHSPRRVAADNIVVDGADLVIGLAREHLREIVSIEPRAWERTFTLKELARGVVRHQSALSVEPRRWKEHLGGSRSVYDLLGDDERDDIPDPYGRSLAAHRNVATEMDRLLGVVVEGLLCLLGEAVR